MDEVATYLAFSTAVGLLQVRDNYKLYIQSGKTLKFDRSFSFLELLWFFVSVAILTIIAPLNYVITVPILFIIFNVLGWIYGIKLYAESNKNGQSEITIPLWYFKSGIVFGLFFSLVSGVVLYLHYHS